MGPQRTAHDDGRSWSGFAEEAPGLAEGIRARFDANLHHILGTIRRDGSPRLSGTEVQIGDGQVTVGMMPASRKLADVRADARAELHSAPLEEDLAQGDAKLAGSLVEVASPGPDGGPSGHHFRLRIRLASLVRVEDDELVLTTWRPDRGVRTARRR